MEEHFTHQYFSRQCFERHHAREVLERALCAGALLFGLTASFAACLFLVPRSPCVPAWRSHRQGIRPGHREVLREFRGRTPTVCGCSCGLD